jgi:hypothetical protein
VNLRKEILILFQQLRLRSNEFHSTELLMEEQGIACLFRMDGMHQNSHHHLKNAIQVKNHQETNLIVKNAQMISSTLKRVGFAKSVQNLLILMKIEKLVLHMTRSFMMMELRIYSTCFSQTTSVNQIKPLIFVTKIKMLLAPSKIRQMEIVLTQM